MAPDGESNERYGPFELTMLNGLPIAVSQKDGSRSLFCRLVFPEPIGPLIPASAGLDIINGQQQMVHIARISSSNIDEAIRKARDQSQWYISDGHTSHELAWYLPTLKQSGKEGVLAGAEDYGVCATSLRELRKDQRFRQAMAQRMEIRRAWGPLGFFWALLLDRLESHARFHSCQACGRLNEGRNGKRFCGPGDNVECYKNRRKLDQRRCRNKSQRTS